MDGDRYDYEDDQAIDTLSLSDFMIYDNNGDPRDFYRLDNDPMEDYDDDDDDDDQFEFSSELLKTSVNDNTIVFCGKIIPYKEPMTIVSQNMSTRGSLESKTSRTKRWRFARFFKKSSKSYKSNIHSDKKVDLKYQVPIRRVSILASAASKPRWYLFLFGFGSSSFSAQMHIRDLKKRQTSIRTNKDREDHKKTGVDRVGPWGLMRFLGCGGGDGGSRGDGKHHPNAIKKLE